MGTVTLYRWRKYAMSLDQMITSRRWGTREAIAEMGGEILEETAVQVDATAVQSDVPGLTAMDYMPPQPPVGLRNVIG